MVDETETTITHSEEGVYKKVHVLVDQWVKLHKGEPFDLEKICRQLELSQRENRNYATIVLSKLTKAGVLEKVNSRSTALYRYIDNTCKYIDWAKADAGETVDICWPYDHIEDGLFGFDGKVLISPGDIIVIAGVSNAGKTAFITNMVWDNMDKYSCTLMGNEYFPGKFKRRADRMTWANPIKEDGTPKFELIERHDNWKDIIRPDNLNFIDWINLGGGQGEEFYAIGRIIEGIQSKLNKGIAVIAIQKDGNKALGLGGGFSQHLASLYLAIDFNVLTVVKAKEWKDIKQDGKTYGFDIVDGGTQFINIRELKKCPKCWGRCVASHTKCDECFSKGYVDA